MSTNEAESSLPASSAIPSKPARETTGPSLLELLLAEQQQLQTPVAHFSEVHDRGATPALEPIYRELIPLTKPGPGEQYAFEVDLDSCTGCKACVAGCHSLNGLDENETWRDVGVLVSAEVRHPFTQTITTACHHCADPACLNGCPVLAYEKDPITGIVRHLDDQCIGCSYCILKCPYDVPKFNEARGIVRKCDMCHSRLAVGEAPACVQACPTQAIKIVTVSTHVSGAPKADTCAFLAQAPSPLYTYPTTRYVTKRPMPANLVGGDHAALSPQKPHWPLVIMLTLMPMAVGCFTVEGFARPSTITLVLTGWLAAAIGLGASVFHLGKPLRAWRVFLGLRRSWLSREAVIFGMWFSLISLYTGTRFSPATALIARISGLEQQAIADLGAKLLPVCVAVGLVGLFCSVMIYVDTQRPFWRISQTGPRFFGTALVLGLATALCANSSLHVIPIGLILTTLFKLAVEARPLRVLDDEDESLTPERKTALLLTETPLRFVLSLRYVLALFAGVLFPILFMSMHLSASWAWLALAGLVGAELTERYLYFRAVVAPKMPGVLTA